MGDTDVQSSTVAILTGLPIFDKIIELTKGAGAPTESDSKRDGFLSYASETHSLGAGLGAGYTATASGDLKLLGALFEAALFGNKGEKIYSASLLRDIRSEKQYFLGGIIAGGLLGVGTRLVYGESVPYLYSLI